MPIYAYACSACGHKKDALQKLSDPPLTDCPACGQPTLTKQVTAAGFQLKGSGWYVTDFRNNSGSDASAKPAASADSSATAATSPASSSGSPASAAAPAPAAPASPPTSK